MLHIHFTMTGYSVVADLYFYLPLLVMALTKRR